MNRRGFLLAAPAIILTPGVLMPVRVICGGQFYGKSIAVVTLADLRTLANMQQRDLLHRIAFPPLIQNFDGSFSKMAMPYPREWFKL